VKITEQILRTHQRNFPISDDCAAVKSGVVCEGGFTLSPTVANSTTMPTFSPTMMPSSAPMVATQSPSNTPTVRAYYFLVKGNIPYAKALASCRKINPKARLAVFKDQDATRAAMAVLLDSNLTVWIGLDDKKSEGHFIWSDGSPLSLSDFIAFDSPSNPAHDDCIVFFLMTFSFDPPFGIPGEPVIPVVFTEPRWQNVNCATYKAGGILCEAGYTPSPTAHPAKNTLRPSQSPTLFCATDPSSTKTSCLRKIKQCKAKGISMKWRGTGCPTINPLHVVRCLL
jgi:hypothetical protein